MLVSVTTVALREVTVVKPWDNKQQSVTQKNCHGRRRKRATYVTELEIITIAITGRTGNKLVKLIIL